MLKVYILARDINSFTKTSISHLLDNMPPLKEGFVILTAILHHVLYIYNPPNVQEIHGCFNRTAEKQCKWIKFNQSNLYNDDLVVVSLLNISQLQQDDDHPSLLRYKLRFTYNDNSSAESSWIKQSLSSEKKKKKKKKDAITASDVILFMSSGFILTNLLFALVYCMVKCKCHVRQIFSREMYSIFKK